MLVVVTALLVALAGRAAAQGTVLPLPSDDRQRIDKLLGAGVVGQALPSAPLTDASVYFPLSERTKYSAVLMKVMLSGKIGPAHTTDIAYYFFAPNVGVVAMISQEDVEAFWIVHIDSSTGKILAP